MTFLNPWGFLGLISLPGILVLHMLRGRSKTIPISSLALWNFLTPEVRGTKFKRIPITLLLIIDLFVGLLLSLALAQPRLLVNSQIKETRHRIIILDNSLSMRADDVLPNRHSQATLAAVKLITEVGAQDIISIIAFNENSVLLGDSRKTNVQDLMKQVTSYKTTSKGHDLIEAFAMATSLIDRIPPQFFVISDDAFEQPQMAEFHYPITWIHIGNSDNNQSTNNLTVEWNGENQLQVFTTITNFNDQPVRRMATLLVDGTPFDSQNLFLPARQEVDLIWQLVTKPGYICVTLLGDDALADDDQRCLGLSDQTKKQVIFICDDCQKDQESLKKNPIYQALSALQNLDVKVMLAVEYSPLMNADWTIFQNYIPSYWPDNLVTVFLSPDIIQKLPEGFFPKIIEERKIAQENSLEIISNDLLLQNIDLSGLRWGNAIEFSGSFGTLTPILLTDTTPLIIKDNSHPYPIYILLTDLLSGNFTQHPSFPLLFNNLVEMTRSSSLPFEVNIGDPIFLPDEELFQTLQIIGPDGSIFSYHSDWPTKFLDTNIPGIYKFSFEDKNGNPIVNYIGVNSGDESESDLFVHPREKIPDNELTQDVNSLTKGIDLSAWLLGLAVVLLLLEARLSWR